MVSGSDFPMEIISVRRPGPKDPRGPSQGPPTARTSPGGAMVDAISRWELRAQWHPLSI